MDSEQTGDLKHQKQHQRFRSETEKKKNHGAGHCPGRAASVESVPFITAGSWTDLIAVLATDAADSMPRQDHTLV